MWKYIAAGVLAAALIGGGVYLEFGWDMRTPRASLTMAGVVNGEYRATTGGAQRAAQTDADDIFLTAPDGREIRVSGSAAPQPRREFRMSDALGVTWIGKTPASMAAFPFHMSLADRETITETQLLQYLQWRHQYSVKPALLANLRAGEFSHEPCRTFSPADLKLRVAGPLMRLGRSTLCAVNANRAPVSRMLVGAVVADGGPWIRPFIRGACRTLAQAWLEKLGDAEPGRLPAYVQCVLVDRPGAPRQPISSLVFEVRKDAALALVQ